MEAPVTIRKTTFHSATSHRIRRTSTVNTARCGCIELDSGPVLHLREIMVFTRETAISALNTRGASRLQGKVHADGRSNLQFTANFKQPLIVGSDAMHRSQPKPRPLADRFGGEERFKNLVKQVRRNSDPCVDDLQARVLRSGGSRRTGLWSGKIDNGADGSVASLHRVGGISNEVQQHLLHLNWIDIDEPVFDDLQGQRNARWNLAAKQALGMSEQRSELHRRLRHRGLAREIAS